MQRFLIMFCWLFFCLFVRKNVEWTRKQWCAPNDYYTCLGHFTNTQIFLEWSFFFSFVSCCMKQHLKKWTKIKSKADSFVNKRRWDTGIRAVIWKIHKLAHVVEVWAAFFTFHSCKFFLLLDGIRICIFNELFYFAQSLSLSVLPSHARSLTDSLTISRFIWQPDYYQVMFVAFQHFYLGFHFPASDSPRCDHLSMPNWQTIN